MVRKRGFTLLEILIVIAIIAVLAAFLVFVLNPSETLKQSRDSQRMSDLQTLNKAIAYLIMSTGGNMWWANLCFGSRQWPLIHISVPNDGEGVVVSDPGGCPTNELAMDYPGLSGYDPGWVQASTANLTRVDGFNFGIARLGYGWLGVDFAWHIKEGSPIVVLPVDPINNVNTPPDPRVNCPDNNDLMYIYSCDPNKLLWELDAKLESKKYTIDENKGASDGGNNSVRYEVGTHLRILPTQYLETP